jgi:hypothetical protein
LRNILSQYPEGSGILKELLQNADDAQASEFHAVYDMRHHGTDFLFAQGDFGKEAQGPAFLAFDNVQMQPENIQAIQNVAQSSKTSDYGKTGRFGIGFNSVYHVTDMPCFVTGKRLYMFDPHKKNLPPAAGNERKTGRSLGFDTYAKVEGQFEPFVRPAAATKGEEDMLSFMPKGPGPGKEHLPDYPCTLFRLPFRTDAQAENSELGRPAFTHKKAMAVMESFSKEASSMCMFLKYIKTIRLSIWHQDETAPRMFSNVEASDDDKEAALKIPKMLSSPDVLDKITAAHNAGDVIESDFVKQITTTMSNESGEVTTVERYLLCNRLGTDAGNPACTLALANAVGTGDQGAKGKGKLRLLPLAGIAALLSRVHDSRVEQLTGDDRFTGSAFCFLPLPIKTGLPVHVNAFFDLSTDRRSITQSTGDMTDSTKAQWNVLLRDYVITPLYCHVLAKAKMLSVSGASGDAVFDPQAYYRLFPRTIEGGERRGENGGVVVHDYFRNIAHNRDNRALGLYNVLAAAGSLYGKVLAKDPRAAHPVEGWRVTVESSEGSCGRRTLHGPDGSQWKLNNDTGEIVPIGIDSGKGDWKVTEAASAMLVPGHFEWLSLKEAFFNYDNGQAMSKRWEKVIFNLGVGVSSSSSSAPLSPLSPMSQRSSSGTWIGWAGRKSKHPKEAWSKNALRNWSHLRQGLGMFIGTEHTISSLLLQDGFCLTIAPRGVAVELLEAAKFDPSVVVNYCTPEAVKAFYTRQWQAAFAGKGGEGRLSCRFTEAPCKSLRTPPSVSSLLKFVLKDQNQLKGGQALADSLNGLPLLQLAVGSQLGVFDSSEARVLVTKNEDLALLPNMQDAFVLASAVPASFRVPEWQKALNIRTLTPERLLSLMNRGGALPLDMKGKDHVTGANAYTVWLSAFYNFIREKKVRNDEFATQFAEWPLIPTEKNSMLFAPKAAKAVLWSTSLPNDLNAEVMAVMRACGAPVVQSSVMLEDLVKHCVSELTGPGLLAVFERNPSVVQELPKISDEGKLSLMKFFATATYGTKEKVACLDMLKSLPLFKTVEGKHVSIAGTQYQILPSTISVGQVQGNFLEEEDALSFFYTDTLKIEKLKQSIFLKEHVLPQLHAMDDAEVEKHMNFMRTNWEPLKSEDGMFVDLLKEVKFLQTVDGTRIPTSQCFDPEVPLFSHFFAHRFPGPAPYNEFEWLPFLRELGLCRKVSRSDQPGQQILAAAKAVERAANQLKIPFEKGEKVGFRAEQFKHRTLDFQLGDSVFVDFPRADGQNILDAAGTVAFVGNSPHLRGDVVGVYLDEPIGMTSSNDDDFMREAGVPDGHRVVVSGDAVRLQEEVFTSRSQLKRADSGRANARVGLVRANSGGSRRGISANLANTAGASAAVLPARISEHYKPNKSSRQGSWGSFECNAVYKYDVELDDGRKFVGVDHRQLCVYNEEAMMETVNYDASTIRYYERDVNQEVISTAAVLGVFYLLEEICQQEKYIPEAVFEELSRTVFLPVVRMCPRTPDKMHNAKQKMWQHASLPKLFLSPNQTCNATIVLMAYSQMYCYVSSKAVLFLE